MKNQTNMREVMVFVFWGLTCLGVVTEAGANENYRIFDDSMHKSIVDVQVDSHQHKTYVESFLVTSPVLTDKFYYWMWNWLDTQSGLSCWGYKKLDSSSLESHNFRAEGFAEKLRDIRLSAEGIPCLTWDGYSRVFWIGNATDHYKTVEDAHKALLDRLAALLKNPDAFEEQSRWIGLDDYLPEDFFYDGFRQGRKFIARLRDVKKSDGKWLFSLEGYGRAVAEVVVDKDYHVVESCYPPINAR